MPFTIERGDDPYMDKLWDQAEERGERKAAIRFIRKSLEVRFGSLPAWAIERIDAASRETLESWVAHLYTATSVEDVLQPGQ